MRFVDLMHRRAVIPIAAAVTVLAGYADLAAGGVSLAPVLLIAGYLILIPAALLTR